MITIYLYGSLKRDFGNRFCFHAVSPADALNGLFSQINGLREKIRAGTFLVRLNGIIQTEQSLEQNFRQPESEAVIHIVPRTAGAGRAGQLIAGVVLIVAGAVVNIYYPGSGAPLIQAGIGLVVGGVAQMLTKSPSLDSHTQGQKASRNTAFSNLDNTIAQGQPVPLAYGLVYCGSRVISQGVESRRIGNNDDPILQNPSANIALSINKKFVAGIPAVAPNGQPYATDFANDSVRARNYVATLSQS